MRIDVILIFLIYNYYMITIKNIDTDKTIEYIFCTRRFPVLKTHLENEVHKENDRLIYEFVNGHNLNDNIYVNDSQDYQWIGLYKGDMLIALQLLHFIDKSIELVITEKYKKYTGNDIFETILTYVENTYKPHKIYTYPLHDKLKEKYKKCGFIEDNNELVKYYK